VSVVILIGGRSDFTVPSVGATRGQHPGITISQLNHDNEARTPLNVDRDQLSELD
jgi:hypothetical protein